MNDDIMNIGVKLIRNIVLKQDDGMSEKQISQRLSDELWNFKAMLTNQAAGASSVFAEVFLKASQEIDTKRLKSAKTFLSAYIDPSWSEESKVRVTEAQIKSDSINSAVEKASIGAICTASIGGLFWVINTFINNKTKPKKWWEK